MLGDPVVVDTELASQGRNAQMVEPVTAATWCQQTRHER